MIVFATTSGLSDLIFAVLSAVSSPLFTSVSLLLALPMMLDTDWRDADFLWVFSLQGSRNLHLLRTAPPSTLRSSCMRS